MWLLRCPKEQKSEKAIQDSLDSLKKTEAREEEVDEVSGALYSLRERNHFAEQLKIVMGGPR